MKDRAPIFIVILIFCIGSAIAAYMINNNQKEKEKRYLPILGDKILDGNDTSYHSIMDFSFIDQDSAIITQKNIENKNFVVEFFFVNCDNICPIMNGNMMKVADAFKGINDFVILSHTVKPEEDSVASLRIYAQKHKANAKQWHFLTGSKVELYRMARKSYLMNNEAGAGDEEDFIHTQFFALIDKDKHIRGYYDGTNDAEVMQLIFDIKLLQKEQKENNE